MNLVAISTAYAPDPEWRRRCEQSVAAQTIPTQHIYIDAAETPGESIEHIWREIRAFDPTTIVLSLDGDDWLPHNQVVERVLREYASGAWLTWGSYAVWRDQVINRCPADVCDVPDRTQCRQLPWFASHLKTYRAGLFQQIWTVDLFTPTGAWITECTDLAVMWPMLEMAGPRGRFIPDILYTYNYTNPRSVHNIGGERFAYQQKEAQRQRAMRPYELLKERPW